MKNIKQGDTIKVYLGVEGYEPLAHYGFVKQADSGFPNYDKDYAIINGIVDPVEKSKLHKVDKVVLKPLSEIPLSSQLLGLTGYSWTSSDWKSKDGGKASSDKGSTIINVHNGLEVQLSEEKGEELLMEKGGEINDKEVWTEDQKAKVELLDSEFNDMLKLEGIERFTKQASDYWKEKGYRDRFRLILGKYPPLNSVDVKFKNPKYNYTTSVSSGVNEKSARDYFVGTMFDVGSFPDENLQKAIDIVYHKGSYEKGGTISAKTDIEKLQLVIHSNLVSEGIKTLAKAKIKELNAIAEKELANIEPKTSKNKEVQKEEPSALAQEIEMKLAFFKELSEDADSELQAEIDIQVEFLNELLEDLPTPTSPGSKKDNDGFPMETLSKSGKKKGVISKNGNAGFVAQFVQIDKLNQREQVLETKKYKGLKSAQNWIKKQIKESDKDFEAKNKRENGDSSKIKVGDFVKHKPTGVDDPEKDMSAIYIIQKLNSEHSSSDNGFVAIDTLIRQVYKGSDINEYVKASPSEVEAAKKLLSNYKIVPGDVVQRISGGAITYKVIDINGDKFSGLDTSSALLWNDLPLYEFKTVSDIERKNALNNIKNAPPKGAELDKRLENLTSKHPYVIEWHEGTNEYALTGYDTLAELEKVLKKIGVTDNPKNTYNKVMMHIEGLGRQRIDLSEVKGDFDPNKDDIGLYIVELKKFYKAK